MLNKLKLVTVAVLSIVGFSAFAGDVSAPVSAPVAVADDAAPTTDNTVSDTGASVAATTNTTDTTPTTDNTDTNTDTANAPVFMQIADLEQSKVLLQLQKERAQLELDLSRLANQQQQAANEADQLSGKAARDQADIDRQKAELESQKEDLEQQLAAAQAAAEQPAPIADDSNANPNTESDLSNKYRVVDIFGVGGELQATLENQISGTRTRTAVGKTVDGYTVQSISLDEGITLVGDDGTTAVLEVGGGDN